MKARDVMSTDLIWIDEEASVWDAFLLMRKNNVSGLPVRSAAGCLSGIITEGDVLRDVKSLHMPQRMKALESMLNSWKESQYEENVYKKSSRPVREVMSSPVITVDEEVNVGDVARIMLEERINRIPVVRDGQVVGMVSRSDILRALVDRREH